MLSEGTGITIGLAALISGAIAVLWWRMETRINEGHKSIKDHIAKEVSKREVLAGELSDHRLHVERYFVSSQTLEKTESRLINAIDKLSARLETLISRIERWGSDSSGGQS